MDQGFILPSSSDVRRPDRFDLVVSDEYEVPFWDLLSAILKSESDPIVDVSSLVSALETIAIILRGSARDAGFELLRGFLLQYLVDDRGSARFFAQEWPVLVDLALEMPSLFPEGVLPSFVCPDDGISEAVFSRRQVACLVVHQFLCSLPPHPWPTESFVDLSPWYSMTSTVHEGAVSAYLTALFTYFERLSGEDQISPLDFSAEEWPIVFTLRTMSDNAVDQMQSDRAKSALLSSTHIDIVKLPQLQTAPQFLGLPDGACLISANKCVGFGPSGTQEELHVGTSPEAYPSVLLTPLLTDNQVLICRGAEAMVSIEGYGRDAQLGEAFRRPNPASNGELRWKNRTMLFMDALELDVLPVEGNSLIPDIYPPSRLCRDMIFKAYSGFSSGAYSHIVTGLWGCRTFGGNRYVKCILQWCAAALAGVPELRFILASTDQQLFGKELVQFAEKVQQSCVSATQMFDILAGLKDGIHDIGPDGIFSFIADQVDLAKHDR
ncbi:hypothetical protein BJY04DRAFT_212885 [Aspergillus karnatakaensis]|uniref:uncharacterized protein n=1 Tax=Aspergillus karnatakaensis TaxID=1810916 RepID=UPI003CCDC9B0